MQNLPFPKIIVVDLAFQRAEFNRHLATPLAMKDFNEIVTRVIFRLLNCSHVEVVKYIGIDVFADKCVLKAKATVELANYLIAYFKALNVYNEVGELPYTPKNFFGDLMTLMHTPD